MALPSPKFYTSTGGEITTHDFGACEAGAYKPDSTGWSFRLYNDYGGSLGSDNMTSVKISVRDDDGGTDEIWTQQHWIQIKSSSGSTGVVDDAMTVFQAVGKNKELSLGDIPSNEYRTLYARCYPPTDATEQDVDFQLRVTYQQPATSICNWITGLRGNGIVASTGDPFAMSTGGSTGTVPYEAGYALINNNEIYYGSSGSYDIETTGSGTYKIYLGESGSFNETTGSVASNELELYEATISSGVCTALIDKRVYLAGIQAGTTGAMSANPDLGDLYLGITNGGIYIAKIAGSWTLTVPLDVEQTLEARPTLLEDQLFFREFATTGTALDTFSSPSDNINLNASTGTHGLLLKMTGTATDYLSATGGWTAPAGTTGGATNFLQLTDTPADYTDDASKLLRVNSSSGAVEFVSTTGIALDTFGTPTDITTNNASTGYHGLLLKLTGSTSTYLNANGTWSTPPDTGEVNTASNQGTTGVGIYYQKSGVDLQFKAIHSTGNITVTDSTGTISINLDVNTTGIPLDDFGDPADNTDLNATTGRHGLLPKFTSIATDYLSATGGYTVPSGTTTFIGLTDTPADFLLDANKLLRVNSSSGAVEFISSTGIKIDDFGTPDDNTDLNASTGRHGLLLKFTGAPTNYLSSTGGWTTPAGGATGGDVYSSGAFTANAIPQISSTGGVIKASPFAVTTGDVMNFGAHSAGFIEQAITTTTGTAAINWNLGNKALFTRSTGAAGAVTFTFTAPENSMNLMLIVRNSSVGSTDSVTWPVVKWQDGSLPTMTTGASDIDSVSFYYSTGLTAYLGLGSANFSTA